MFSDLLPFFFAHFPHNFYSLFYYLFILYLSIIISYLWCLFIILYLIILCFFYRLWWWWFAMTAGSLFCKVWQRLIEAFRMQSNAQEKTPNQDREQGGVRSNPFLPRLPWEALKCVLCKRRDKAGCSCESFGPSVFAVKSCVSFKSVVDRLFYLQSYAGAAASNSDTNWTNW